MRTKHLAIFSLSWCTVHLLVSAELTCDTTLDGPFEGQITYYDYADHAAAGGGSCMIDTKGDHMVGAMNTPDLDGRLMCGMCVEISNDSGDKVVIKIVDRCPGCADHHEHNIDLSPEAFEALYPLVVGRVLVTWRTVECPHAGNIGLNFKFPESGGYWWGVRPINVRHGVQSLAVKPANENDDRTEWIDFDLALNTQQFKKPTDQKRVYFPFFIRITSVYDEVVEYYVEQEARVKMDTIGTDVQFSTSCGSDSNPGDVTNNNNNGTSAAYIHTSLLLSLTIPILTWAIY